MTEKPRNLIGPLKRSVEKYPDKPALIFYGRRITYRELDQVSDNFAAILHHFGIRKGDRVSFVAANTPHVPIAFLAVWKIGAVVAAVNPLENSEKVLSMINLVEPSKIIILENFKDHLNTILCHYDQSKIWRVSPADYLSGILRVGYKWKNRKNKLPTFGRSWNNLFEFSSKRLSERSPLWPPPVTVQSDDLAVLQYTGGTSGVPKAAMLTHGNLVANCSQAISKVNEKETLVGPDTVFLGVMPFFHVYGLSVCLTMAFSLGATVVLLPKFEVKEVFETIAKYKVNVFPGIQRMFGAMVNYAKSNPAKYRKKLQSLKLSCSGAGRLDDQVRKDFELLSGAPIFEGYGLSEASPVVSIYFARGEMGKLGTPLPNTEIRVAEDGELLVRGPQVMQGYWRNPEANGEAFTEDGWLKTGDMAHQHEDGSWQMDDRKKDMLKIAGENVYSQVVEKVLLSYPGVSEAAVIGLPDPKTDERLVACLVMKDSLSVRNPQSIIAHCRTAGLSGVQVPRKPEDLIFLKEIPKNIVGKVLKRELIAKLVVKTSS